MEFVPPDEIDPVAVLPNTTLGPETRGSTLMLNESLAEETFFITMVLLRDIPEE